MSMLDNFPLLCDIWRRTAAAVDPTIVESDVPCNYLPAVRSGLSGNTVLGLSYGVGAVVVPPSTDVRPAPWDRYNPTFDFPYDFVKIQGCSLQLHVMWVADYYLFQANWYRECWVGALTPPGGTGAVTPVADRPTRDTSRLRYYPVSALPKHNVLIAE